MQNKKQPTVAENLDDVAIYTSDTKILGKYFPSTYVHLFRDI